MPIRIIKAICENILIELFKNCMNTNPPNTASGTTLFIKNPNEKGFVSFHQDAKYIGLEPHNWVTAWLEKN